MIVIQFVVHLQIVLEPALLVLRELLVVGLNGNNKFFSRCMYAINED